MSNQLSQTLHEQPHKLTLLQWHDDPHCIALVERIAETLMQDDDNVIESGDTWTQHR
jgi:hypothetical protein